MARNEKEETHRSWAGASSAATAWPLARTLWSPENSTGALLAQFALHGKEFFIEMISVLIQLPEQQLEAGKFG